MSESRQVRRAKERALKKGASEEKRLITRAEEMLATIIKKNEREPEVNPNPTSDVIDPTSHPGRYPKHENTLKGQVYGGECNVTRCTNTDAVFWNIGTHGLYCKTCAKGINWRPQDKPLCIYVEEKPSFEEMNRLEKEMYL